MENKFKHVYSRSDLSRLKKEEVPSSSRLHTEPTLREEAETEASYRKPVRSPDLRLQSPMIPTHKSTASCYRSSSISTEIQIKPTRSRSSNSHPSDSNSSTNSVLSTLQEENQKQHIEILRLTQLIRDLRKQISALPVTELTLRNYEQEMRLKEQRIRQLEEAVTDNVNQETKKLTQKYAESQQALSQARSALDKLAKRGSDASDTLYQAMSLFQRDNKVLKAKITSQMEQKASRLNYKELEMQLHEVEEMQEKLIRENIKLKGETDKSETELTQLRSTVTALALNLTVISQEFSQLTETLKLAETRVGVSAQQLLERLGQTFSPPVALTSAEDLLQQAVTKLSLNLSQLRRLLSDMYSDQCGQMCVQQ